MSLFPGDESFESIRETIFRIGSSWIGSNGDTVESSATAFSAGRWSNSRRLVLATAKHVVEVPDDQTVTWTITQYSDTDEVSREISFGTNRALKGDVPYRTHNELDVAIFTLPARLTKQGDFDQPNDSIPKMISCDLVVSEGTRIAWAGFPGAVECFLSHPRLCYFEGVVSAIINRLDKHIYLVDGHASHGVSGGPVWWWNEDERRSEIVGIVSGYGPAAESLPGFCVFEPIQPVFHFLASTRRTISDDYMIFS